MVKGLIQKPRDFVSEEKVKNLLGSAWTISWLVNFNRIDFQNKNQAKVKFRTTEKIIITDNGLLIPFRFVGNFCQTTTIEQKQSLPGRTKLL